MPELKLKFVVSGVKGVLSAFAKIAGRARKMAATVGKAMRGVGGAMKAIGKRAALVGVGFGAMLGMAGKAAGRFEMLKLRLKVVTGSAEKAETAFKDIFKLSTKTPFDPQELVEASVLLRAFGQDSEEALISAAEAAAAMDTPVQDIAKAVGSMETEPLRALGLELSRAGDAAQITFRDKLGKEVTKSAKGVDNIRKMILETFSAKFGGGLAEASQTLEGLISTLKGNVTSAFAAVGDKILPVFKIIIAGLNRSVEALVNNNTLGAIGDKLSGFLVGFGGVVMTMTQSMDAFKSTAVLVGNVILAALKDGATKAAEALKNAIVEGWENAKKAGKKKTQNFVEMLIFGEDQAESLGPIKGGKSTGTTKTSELGLALAALTSATQEQREKLEKAMAGYTKAVEAGGAQAGKALMKIGDELPGASGLSGRGRTESGISVGDLERWEGMKLRFSRGTGKVGLRNRVGTFKEEGRAIGLLGSSNDLRTRAAARLMKMKEQTEAHAKGAGMTAEQRKNLNLAKIMKDVSQMAATLQGTASE